MHKCWPEEMESGVVCLFWLRGCPEQAPLLGAGREGCRGINGGKEGKIRKKNGSAISMKASTQVKPMFRNGCTQSKLGNCRHNNWKFETMWTVWTISRIG